MDFERQRLHAFLSQAWLVRQKDHLETALTSISALQPPIEGSQELTTVIQGRLNQLRINMGAYDNAAGGA